MAVSPGKVVDCTGSTVGRGTVIDEGNLMLTDRSLSVGASGSAASGDVGEGLVTAASALRSSLLLFSRLEWRSLSLL